MKKFLTILSVAVLTLCTIACTKDKEDKKTESNLPSAAGVIPVVTVNGTTATFNLPEGTTGVVPIWYTNESGEFVFAGNGDGFSKTFYDAGTFTVRMYLSNSNGQSADYSEAQFTIEASQEGFNGYNYNSEYNIWKVGEDAGMSKSYSYYNPGWNSGDGTFAFTTKPYKFTINAACNSQWQAQLHLVPDADVNVVASSTYDFSCLITLNKDCGGVTVKVTAVDSDDNFIFLAQEDMKEGTNVFYMKDVNTNLTADAAVKVVFDFGWAAEGTEVSIDRITLKDHANDDGTNAPDKEEPTPEPTPDPEIDTNADFRVDAATNLWRSAKVEVVEWFSAADWSGALSGGVTVGAGNDVTLTVPEGIGGSEWMGQVKLGTDISVSSEKLYDFCSTVNAEGDFAYTIKLARFNDDSNFEMLYTNAATVASGTGEYKIANLKGQDIDNLVLIYDFGRTPAGTKITINNICFQEHIDK